MASTTSSSSASDDIGGNWYFNKSQRHVGLLSEPAYRHLQMAAGVRGLSGAGGLARFPHHAQLLQYFRDDAAHFGLREAITFNTGVEKADRLPEGGWQVRLSNGETEGYEALGGGERAPLGSAHSRVSGPF